MKRLSFILLLSASLGSCVVTPDGTPPKRQPRYVSMPPAPGILERQYMPEVADTLEDYDFRAVNTPGERYSLDFLIEEGPINVDSTITLYKDGRIIAQARGRDGGVKKALQPAKYIQRAYERSLEDFEDQLDRLDNFERADDTPPAYYPPTYR
jgi:hypothetical protein